MSPSLSISEFETTLQALSSKLPSVNIELILLSYLTRLLNTRIISLLNDCLREHGLTESLWQAMVVIYSQPEHEILPSELSDILNMTRTCITRLSDELVQNNWVVRYTHAHDRRKITLKLTAAGEELIRRVTPHTNKIRQKVWSALDATEQKQLHHVLQKLLHQP